MRAANSSRRTTELSETRGPEGAHRTAGLTALSLGALGIVFGDIGTSPLYAFRESFGESDIAVAEANILGVLSLIFWSLVLVITIKYLVFVMKADNVGEGGILALTSLGIPAGRPTSSTKRALLLLGLFGTALLYGDGMITPAISVLSAVEGAEIAAPSVEPWVLPISCAILLGLFSFQFRGTAAVGRLFGPVMVVWFGVLGALGLTNLLAAPEVLEALNPLEAVWFFGREGISGVLVLGSVFLVVTGGEALYADMGHFGRRPIQIMWYSVVLPGLVLNYFGQGALLLDRPETIENPFYELVPNGMVIPLAILATGATVIASQALVSGAFSLTMQAIHLGYLPRLRIRHTSASQMGQIYIPAVNWTLAVACIALVLGFRSSSNLAAAYGVAVTMTMFITTVLFFVVARERWGWSTARAGVLCGAFLVIDIAFLGANLVKIPDGGWFPLVIGAVVFTMMTTWRTGRLLVEARLRENDLPLEQFVRSVTKTPPTRVPGTAVFMSSRPEATPGALLANVRFNDILHEQVVVLGVQTDPVPLVPAARRVHRIDHGSGFSTITLRFGFMEQPDVPRALSGSVAAKIAFDPLHTTYFLGRERVFATDRDGMAKWRERLFAVLLRNATDVGNFFHLPTDRTVEIGRRVEI